MPDDISRLERTFGRYLLFGQIGAGGMAAVHLGRRVGSAGFSRLVAIKRLHPHLAKEKEFVHSFLDEARIAARVSHPNVVSIDDVVMDGDEVFLVMEYVHGRSLSFLAQAERAHGRAVPPSIAAAIALDMLHGLQAAHVARDERGRELGLVHRDVSPQNVLVGVDGVARVLDFGIAKALGRLQTTEAGAIKGKLAYMAPERLLERKVTLSVDVYSAGIVIWEMLAGERYFDGPSDETMFAKVAAATYRHLTGPAFAELDVVLERALGREPERRHASCNELAHAIHRAADLASRAEVMAWVQKIAGAELAESAAVIEEIERSSVPSPPPVSKAEPLATPREAPVREAPGPRPEDVSPGESISLETGGAVTRARPSASTSARSAGARRMMLATAAIALALGAVLAIKLGGVSQSRAATPEATPSSPAPVVVDPPPAPTSTFSTTTTTTATTATAVSASRATAPASPPVAPAATSRPGPPSSARRAPRAAADGGATASASASVIATPVPEAPSDRK